MFALLAVHAALVGADLPTHCTLSDLVGRWRFTIVQNPSDSTCGYPSPQTMSHNLAQTARLRRISAHSRPPRTLPRADPLAAVVNPSSSNVLEFTLRLTASINFSGRGFEVLQDLEPDPASNQNLLSGFWTPVFNQGLMLKDFQLEHQNSVVEYSRALAYSAFECVDPSGAPCLSAQDVSVGRDEKPPSPFRSMCSSTLVGWAVTRDPSNRQTHCFRGERIGPLEVSDVVCPVDRPATSLKAPQSEALPEVYTDPLVSWLERKFPAVNQRACGSCYVHASLFALRASFLKTRVVIANFARPSEAEIAEVHAELDQRGEAMLQEGHIPNEKALLQSFANQECKGGHPMFVGLALMVAQRLPVNFDFLKGRYFPGCPTSVREIERHLIHQGPVIVAVDVPEVNALNPYMNTAGSVELEGENGVRVLTSLTHTRSKSEYEYANHAMVIIGYGVGIKKGSNGDGERVPYWVVRNSWGLEWPRHGDGGNVRILKGKNVGGIESQAMSLTYEFSTRNFPMI